MKNALNILSGLGIAVWAICFFFGFNCLIGTSDSAVVISAFVAILLAIAMGFLVFMLKKWSGRIIGVSVSNARRNQMILLFIYFAIVIPTCGSVVHFINLETSIKEDIQPQAKEKYNELLTMISDEDTKGSYRYYVEEQIRLFEEGEKAGNDSDLDVRIADMRDQLTNDIYETSNEIEDFLGYCISSVDNWEPLTIANYLIKLDEKYAEWQDAFIEISKNCEYTKSEPYKPIDEYRDTKLSKAVCEGGIADADFLSIMLMVLIQFVVLLTYLAYLRLDRKGPGRDESEYEITYNLDNE